jgi:hypothetical protein
LKVRNLALLIVSALLLPSCADNPYSSMSSESQLMIEKDIHFLEMYKNTLCSINEMRELEEITRGKCLALYYDFKLNDSVQDGKKEVAERISYILANPDKFDKIFLDRLSIITTKIEDCTRYIKENCM